MCSVCSCTNGSCSSSGSSGNSCNLRGCRQGEALSASLVNGRHQFNVDDASVEFSTTVGWSKDKFKCIIIIVFIVAIVAVDEIQAAIGRFLFSFQKPNFTSYSSQMHSE